VSYVELGERLVAVGAVLTFVSAALDGAVHDLRTTRRVGRVVLLVAGWLVRPLVAFHRRLGESPVARCARAGHRPAWDGYHEYCLRCDRRLLRVVVDDLGTEREKWVYPDDPRIVPDPIRAPTTPSGASSAHRARWHVTVGGPLDPLVERLDRDVRDVRRRLDELRPRDHGHLGDPLRWARIGDPSLRARLDDPARFTWRTVDGEEHEL